MAVARLLLLSVAYSSVLSAAGPVKDFIKDFGKDQVYVAESPFRMKASSFFGIFLPLAAGTAAITYGDPDAARYASTRPSLQDVGRGISWVGASYTLLGASTAGILIFRKTGQSREAKVARNALLATSIALADTQVMKLMFGRQRPDQGTGDGDFWKAKYSFPSGHAMSTWAMAAAIARAPGTPRWVAVLAYSTATAVSVARWMAWRHFPADIVAGSTLGFFIGDSVSRRHPAIP